MEVSGEQLIHRYRLISKRELGLDPERANIGLGPFGLEEGLECGAAKFMEVFRAEVGPQAIPDDGDGFTDAAAQVLEEGHHLGAFDRSFVQLKVDTGEAGPGDGRRFFQLKLNSRIGVWCPFGHFFRNPIQQCPCLLN